MNNLVKVFDTSLRDGEQSPGFSMHIDEKLELAKQLEKLKVDIIEAGFPASSTSDFNAVKQISAVLKNTTITALARAKQSDIENAYEAIKNAVSPRIHLFIATSPIHLKYKLNMTEDEVIESIKKHVALSKRLVPDVEFSAEDASRTPLPFLAKAISTAIDFGATTVNIPDTVGYSTPEEMFNIISYLKNNVENIDRAIISCHNHNDLGLGVANTLSCLKAGCRQVECTINGIGERAGNASLEEIVMALKTRYDIYNLDTNIETAEIYKTSKLLSSICGITISPNKAIVGKNAFSHESGIHQHGVLQERSTYEIMNPSEIGIPENTLVLGKHSGKHAFDEHLKEMGVELSPDELLLAFDKFKGVCERKKFVSRKDLEAIISHSNSQIRDTDYHLVSYEIISIKDKFARASLMLRCGEEIIEKSSEGDGPLDASFKAFNATIKKDVSLYDFSVHSVSEGEDALGEAIVKVFFEGNTYTGRGVSTDIIEASISAYINGVNKLLDTL